MENYKICLKRCKGLWPSVNKSFQNTYFVQCWLVSSTEISFQFTKDVTVTEQVLLHLALRVSYCSPDRWSVGSAVGEQDPKAQNRQWWDDPTGIITHSKLQVVTVMVGPVLKHPHTLLTILHNIFQELVLALRQNMLTPTWCCKITDNWRGFKESAVDRLGKSFRGCFSNNVCFQSFATSRLFRDTGKIW